MTRERLTILESLSPWELERFVALGGEVPTPTLLRIHRRWAEERKAEEARAAEGHRKMRVCERSPMLCKHCEDSIRPSKCPVCGETIGDACLTCHQELAHGRIPHLASIHFAGGHHGPTTPRQAYKAGKTDS